MVEWDKNIELTPEVSHRLVKNLADLAGQIIEQAIKPFLAELNKLVEQYPELFTDDPVEADRKRSRDDLQRKRSQMKGKNRYIQPTRGEGMR